MQNILSRLIAITAFACAEDTEHEDARLHELRIRIT